MKKGERRDNWIQLDRAPHFHPIKSSLNANEKGRECCSQSLSPTLSERLALVSHSLAAVTAIAREYLLVAQLEANQYSLRAKAMLVYNRIASATARPLSLYSWVISLYCFSLPKAPQAETLVYAVTTGTFVYIVSLTRI